MAILGGWFALHSMSIAWDGLHDEPEVADVAVVLGNRIEPSGKPGITVRLRLDRVIELYRGGKVAKIVVSGGKGREGFEEADVMRDDLVANGIPESDIVVDRTGVDTWSTARAMKVLARENGWSSVVVVTSWFHVSRTKLAMRRVGLADVRGAHGRVRFDSRDAYSVAREFFAYYDYWLLRATG